MSFPTGSLLMPQTFSTIDSLKLHNLVIDLRNNFGGNSLMGDILLSYWKLPDSLATFTCDLCISELMLKDYDMDLENIKKILAEELNRELEDFTLPYVIQDGDEWNKKYQQKNIVISK